MADDSGAATPTPDRTRLSNQTATGAGTTQGELTLVVVGEQHFASHALPVTGSVTIGRSNDCSIPINERSLSRKHAELEVGPPLRITDLGSANGTEVRSTKLTEGESADIAMNEAILLGSVTVIVQERRVSAQRRLLRSHDYLEERLYDECSRADRYGRSLGLVHLRLLREIDEDILEQAAAESLRPSDVVGIYGPAQYDILLLDLGAAEEARAITERLERALLDRGAKLSMAVATYPIDGRTPSELAATARARARGSHTTDESNSGPIISDPAMKELHELVKRIANAEITVLLLGETGVGKEVIAAQIHENSQRKTGPFLKINCAALSQSLLESELFGHEKGSFTGATSQKKGLLEAAAGGTVFLDEIGEMPAETQAKLLRVLEDRRLMRVGGVESIEIDVRFVAATNRDLETEISRGRFREDLFYRLNGFTLTIPPLRKRASEVLPLATAFVARVCKQLDRYPEPELGADAIAVLESYEWPGNIRELRNIVERATILCTDSAITADDLPDKLTRKKRRAGTDSGVSAAPLAGFALKRKIEPAEEKRLILAALDETGGNQTKAAKLLGISRRALTNKLNRHGIRRPRKK